MSSRVCDRAENCRAAGSNAQVIPVQPVVWAASAWEWLPEAPKKIPRSRCCRRPGVRRARAAADALEGCQSQAFHNHCVLAKVLVNTRKRPANVLADELYDEAREKDVPISEWPNWVVHRMSGGEPLSRWLQGAGG